MLMMAIGIIVAVATAGASTRTTTNLTRVTAKITIGGTLPVVRELQIIGPVVVNEIPERGEGAGVAGRKGGCRWRVSGGSSTRRL